MTRKVMVLGPALDAVSGVSTHLNQLLSSTLSATYVLVHFQVGSEGRRESNFGKRLRLVSSPISLGLRILWERPAIVHLNTSLDNKAYWRDVIYLLVAKLLRRKVVYQVHGGKLPLDFFRGRSLLTQWLKATLQLPDVVVLLASVELQAYRVFASAQHLLLIPNAVNIPLYRRTQITKVGDSEPCQLVYIGRLVWSKGLFDLLHALSLLRQRGITVDLVLAGDGPDREALHAKALELGVASQVNFMGAVNVDAKVKLLHQSDVFVLASHGEGLPYALIEAMAAGLAIVATAVGAIPDAVEQGVHGLLVQPAQPVGLADALQRVVQDPIERARFGRAAAERAASLYSLERLSADFKDLYDGLLDPRHGNLAYHSER